MALLSEVILQSVTPPIKSTLINGIVISVNPLIIEIEDKLPIPESCLILHPFCIETIVNLEHKHVMYRDSEGNPVYTETALESALLWRGLRVGDEVRMLNDTTSQKYCVLQRVEGIT